MVRTSDSLAWHPVRATAPCSAPISELAAGVTQVSPLLTTLLACFRLSLIHETVQRGSKQLLRHYVELDVFESIFRYNQLNTLIVSTTAPIKSPPNQVRSHCSATEGACEWSATEGACELFATEGDYR